MKDIASSVTKHIHAFGELLVPQSKTWNELGLHMNCVSLNLIIIRAAFRSPNFVILFISALCSFMLKIESSHCLHLLAKKKLIVEW